MPPRKVVPTVTETETESEGEGSIDTAQSVVEEANTVALFPRPARSVRANHAIAQLNTNRGTLYRHKDILDRVWDFGFLYSEVMSTDVYAGAGPFPGEPLAVVVVRTHWQGDDGIIYFFDGVGDASPSNCHMSNQPFDPNNPKGTSQHFTRMAATRAFDRSVGLAMNLDSNSAEEFAGNDDAVQSSNVFRNTASSASRGRPTQSNSFTPQQPQYDVPEQNSDTSISGYECEVCGEPVLGNDHKPGSKSNYTSAQLASISQNKYGGIYCWDHGKGRAAA